jgi:outer membrane protein, multidrug efflux system
MARLVCVASFAITASLLVALSGCTVGPDYRAPEIATPEAFASLDGASGAGVTTAATSVAPGQLSYWWRTLGDEQLSSLIDRAVANNLDLKLAEARLREARALRGVAESGLYPGVDASGSAERRRTSENTGQPGFAGTRNTFRTGLDASWELDIFGGVRRDIEASRADVEASAEDKQAILVSLAAEVATNYIQLRAAQQRQLVSDSAITTQGETVELTQSRLEAGLAAELEVAQSQAQLATRKSQKPPLFTAERAAMHRLSVLLGQSPSALAQELSAKGQIPSASGEVAVGIPSDLLRRRPDIRRAERRIAAASARIGVATADLFPRFSLTGNFGFESGKAEDLFDASSRTWGFGPSVRWNIFDAGRIRRLIDAAGEREKQALISYEQAILTSLEDVENALVRLTNEQMRNRALNDAVTANKRAVALADERYRSGVGDFLNVLESQRQLYDAEDQAVQSDAEVTTAVISLYRALGGGWADGERTPDTAVSSQQVIGQ